MMKAPPPHIMPEKVINTVMKIGKSTTLLLAPVFGMFVAVSPAVASPAQTEWQAVESGVTIQLFTTNIPDRTGTVWAAIHLRLADGWKTYWRNPGEIGIPMVVDWSKSDNIKALQINWPMPQRSLASGYLEYVYEREVVLPLALKLSNPSRRALLDASLQLGVCSDVCIPIRWRGALHLDPSAPSGAHIFRMERARARVPRPDHRVDAPFSSVILDVVGNRFVLDSAAEQRSNSSLIVSAPDDSTHLFDVPHFRPELGLLTVEGLGGADLSAFVGKKVDLLYDSKDGPYIRHVGVKRAKTDKDVPVSE